MIMNYEKTLKTKGGWTKIPNAIRHDKNLTSDAKVVIEELLSISGEFHISESGLASSVHLSLERVKKAIRLLKSTGYIQLSPTKRGTQFIGYEWQISDAAGTFRKFDSQQTENPSTGIPSDGKPTDRKTRRPETQQTENPTTYQNTERYQHTNNQERIDEHTEEDQPPHHQAQALEEEEVSPPPYQFPSFSSESSSEATASPLQGEKPEHGEEVISQKEYMYQQFLEKFPKAPLVREKELTRQAFFDIPNLEQEFDRIMWGLDEWCRSPEWRKDNGQYIKKPLNWIEERQWEKANISEALSDAYMDQLDILFPTEEG